MASSFVELPLEAQPGKGASAAGVFVDDVGRILKLEGTKTLVAEA